MSKLFRDWYEKCTSDFDNLTPEEKQEWIDFCVQEERNQLMCDQVDRIAKALGADVPHGTNLGGKKWK